MQQLGIWYLVLGKELNFSTIHRPSIQDTAQAEAQFSNISSSTTPQPDYGLSPPGPTPPPQPQAPPPPAARPAPYPEYLTRQPQYHHAPHSQSGAPGMAQATSPSMPLNDGQQSGHRSPSNLKSDTAVPIDPSIAASSPSYPPPYSPYTPQGHDMAQYQGHPPPQMYGRPDWPPHQYGQHPHGMPGTYSSPGTTVGSASPAATAGPRPGQVYSFVPIPGAQQHKRPRRRYEEIERMYKCGWNGCEKAYGTLNHLNAHVTMQSHGAKRTPEETTRGDAVACDGAVSLTIPDAKMPLPTDMPSLNIHAMPLLSGLLFVTLSYCILANITALDCVSKHLEFKEIRKEWKARKKEEENQRKAAEERERAAAQANQVDGNTQTDPSQSAQPASYPAGVRPQLPPIGYQPADGQVPGQYGASAGQGLVYPPSNGQMTAQYPPANYPHSPYGQGNQVYQPRE
ncbi:hypothetical protein PABG_02869 [Paracoccidioides brasiliensis Pb03]|nr:hypothetical protein PABG_02869 [Paracoccidioides brasiliensis Pb03]